VRRLSLGLALVALATGCASTIPAKPLPADDPRPAALLAAWHAHVAGRDALQATARLAVDAAGAGDGGRDLALRSKQRMWLAKPAQLRVEVLGFLDTTLAVLVTDGERYSLFESQEQRLQEGPVYPELLWDAARLALTPAEAVEVILGAPEPDAGLVPRAAYLVGDRVRIELADPGGRVRRVVEFGAGGELRRLAQSDEQGGVAWEAQFDDFAEVGGAPFARNVAVRSSEGRTRAELVLRAIELNPEVPPDIFRLRPPGETLDPETRSEAPVGGARAWEGG
jgi:hypothetical protein